MGAGAAALMPGTLSILTNVFTRPVERVRAIGIWSGATGLGVAIGPILGGYLVSHYWWGSVFLVNVPVDYTAIVSLFIIQRIVGIAFNYFSCRIIKLALVINII